MKEKSATTKTVKTKTKPKTESIKNEILVKKKVFLQSSVKNILIENKIEKEQSQIVAEQIADFIIEADSSVQFIRETLLRELLEDNIDNNVLKEFLSSLKEFNIIDYIYDNRG